MPYFVGTHYKAEKGETIYLRPAGAEDSGVDASLEFFVYES